MTPCLTLLPGAGRDVIPVHTCDLWAVQGIPARQLPAGTQAREVAMVFEKGENDSEEGVRRNTF